MSINDDIRSVEKEHDVLSIEKKGLSLWLSIRNRIFFKRSIGKESAVDINSGVYWMIIRTIFYGFFNWFRNYEVWLFSTSLNRVLVDGKYYDRLMDYPAAKFDKALLIELPSKKHYKRSQLASKYIVSKSVFITLEKMYELFLSANVKNKEIAVKIAGEFDMKINTKYAIKKMISQYKIMKFTLRFGKPKCVFIAPSYTNYGYIKAFKEKGVKVIEIQHGVINSEHFGYNIYVDADRNYFPDYLLSLGQREKEVFVEPNNWINAEHVIPVGSFYIEQIRRTFKEKKEITELRSKFKVTIGASLQDCKIGFKLIPIIIELAEKNPDFLFLLKPRRTSIEYYQKEFKFPENVQFMGELNVYETILSSDFHLTAYSSCAIEAPALGKRNILMNIDNKAKEYYSAILTNQLNTRFANDIQEFESIIHISDSIKEEEIRDSHSNVISPNFELNMDQFIQDKLR